MSCAIVRPLPRHKGLWLVRIRIGYCIASYVKSNLPANRNNQRDAQERIV